MNDNIKFALEYVNAIEKQARLKAALNLSFVKYRVDAEVITLTPDAYIRAYENLLKSVIGENNFTWLEWWAYECDFGTEDRKFWINEKEYDVSLLTLEQFLNLVWENVPENR